MGRVGNTVNLEDGDRYDLLTLDFPGGYPVGKLKVGFGKTPRRISGVQKVSQIFLKALATPSGTDVLYPSRGTFFGELTGSYNLEGVSTNEEMSTMVRGAVVAAESQAKAILNIKTAPAASRLQSAEVVKLTAIEDGVMVQIKLVSEAGEMAPIALPFTSLGIKVNA